ncbi:SulP family inorganic anion transporter [Flammeovirga yaeyamensis]|uniref:SulP family inorganic anion transporter n=1 Tax=Flammeovirga yaeyamensis TaxID=367791 RepID=A0AAX1N518_9BACT|nr:SulP family inorganic anion transporter [Flammeovirga yaeyamensis]MBB3701335.1 MFS superfamily sulfate permease-like transporter [Flammeovirga yaeyamensis]NMF38197.1 SulP family inorganic anion transporter [Flammeovirga yaeyamensis]QWG02611.1 SulP family inorganic anion transporter [Flammeovirga yaeyamensis]
MKEQQQILNYLKSDIPSSIVVFLVAVPLCLGIALASGAPLFSGIIAGIVGGIIVTSISGSQLGVSGPAAGLAVIVLNAINELGAFETFLLAVVIAGVLQIFLGVLKAGVIGYYFPSSVIKGMLTGIGLIIFLKQIPHAVGYDADPEGDFAFFQVDGHTTFSELWYMTESITWGSVVITLVSLIILISWERPFIKNSFLKMVPGPLLAVAIGIILNVWFDDIPVLDITSEHLVAIPVAGSFGEFFNQFTLPDFNQLANTQVYVVAFTIAVVASLETLLSVEATDKLDPQKRVTPTNRELVAQGVGNIVSGMIGGLPVTQVIVRSSANIQSGGRTRLSAFLHGVLILICVMVIPKVLNLIPLSSLAAILLVIGYKLINPKQFKELYKKGINLFLPFIVTVLGIVFTDLLRGIGLGMAVGIINILWNNFKIPYHLDPKNVKLNDPLIIHLAEDVSFLNKASILRTLNKIPDGMDVIIDASKNHSIHPDVLEIIDDFQETALERKIKLTKVGFDKIRNYDPENDFQKLF